MPHIIIGRHTKKRREAKRRRRGGRGERERDGRHPPRIRKAGEEADKQAPHLSRRQHHPTPRRHTTQNPEWSPPTSWLMLTTDSANTASHMALLKAKYTSETSKILEYQKDSHKAIASCTKALQNVSLPQSLLSNALTRVVRSLRVIRRR